MPGLQHRGDNRMGSITQAEADALFSPSGVLVDTSSRKPAEVRRTVENAPKQPETLGPTDAELDVQEEKSKEVQAALKITELRMALDDALNVVHNAQTAKIGGQNSHSDLMVRHLIRDVANKLGQEQRKQNTAELQGQAAKLGEELKKLGPAMGEFWKNQVSINGLDLPN